MNFNEGFGGQPFGSVPCTSSSSIPPFLQPLLDASSAGNFSASQLEAIRNAAISAASTSNATSNSTQSNAFINSLTPNPFGLPLPPLPQMSTTSANQAQITSDLLYTQSASSLFFPIPAFHQQSRLTLSSSSSSSSSASSFANTPSALNSTTTATHLMPPGTATAAAAAATSHFNFLAQNASPLELSAALATLNANAKAMDSTTNETQDETKSCTTTPTPDPCAMLAALAARFPSAEFLAANFPSLWYSSLAARGLAILSHQIYLNNMLKSASNGTPLPMPPLFPDLTQQPPFFPLPNPFESFLASNTANLSPLNNSMQNVQMDSDTKPFAMQAIPLLSSNNSRYQQPLPELKISPCDSTKVDSDRKKFSPDSSTALHSPQRMSNALSNGHEDQSPIFNNQNTLKSPVPIRPNPTSPYSFLLQHDPTQAGCTIQNSINPIANLTNPPIAHSRKSSSKAYSRAIAGNQPTIANSDEPTFFKPINDNSMVTDYSCKPRPKPTPASPSKFNSIKRKQNASTSNKKHRETISLDDLTPTLNQLVLPSNRISDAGLPLPPVITSELSNLPIPARTFGNLHQTSSPLLSNTTSSLSPLIASVDLLATSSSNTNATTDLVSINYNTQSPVVSSTKQNSSDLSSSSPELIGSPLFLSQSSHSLSPCVPRLPSPVSPTILSAANPHSPVDPIANVSVEINPNAALSTNTNTFINPTRTRCVPPKKTIQSASTCASYNPVSWGSPSSDQIPSPKPTLSSDLYVKSPLIVDAQSEKLFESEEAILSNKKHDKLLFGQLEFDSEPAVQESSHKVEAVESKLNEEPEVKDDQQQRIPKLSIKLDKCKNKERKNKRSKRPREDSQSSSSTMSDLINNDLIRRHSTDEMLLTSKDTQSASSENDFATLPRIRCDTYSGPESLDKSRNKRTSKKRDSATNLDPWTIRRSERIFLHSAYQSHSNPNESSGSLNLILTSNRKLQKDAADAAAAEKQTENISDEQTNSSNQVTTGMFSGSVALLGNYGHVSPEDCQLLELIEWTREDRLPKTSEFKLQRKQLHQQRQRILLRSDELLYAGQTRCESQNDDELKTSVLLRLDGETNDRHMTLQQLLNQAIREYKPIKIDQLHEGTRVCAFWSNRARCLYPGRISKLLANDLVQVEFDDGDKARIALTDIRLLPDSFICESEIEELTESVEENMQIDSLSSGACSERVGESAIRIRLNSSSDRHKRRKHHHAHKHHHLKRRKHKKRSKNLLKSSLCDLIETEENDSKNNSKAILDDENESLDESSDSESDCDSDLAESLNDSNVFVAGDDKSANGNQWICEMNDERASRRNQQSISCKAVIRRKQSNKKATVNNDSKQKTSNNGGSKIAAFLLDRQLWHWHGEPNRSMRGRYRSKKLFYNAIIRDDEIIRVNDCAVFLSTGRPSLPFVGRIDSMWQNPNGTMLVRVRWFYHPEETKTQPELLDSKGALFESDHFDNNEVQTISHKCLVLPYHEYVERKRLARLNGEEDEDDPPNIYYFSGLYESLSGRISIDEAVPFK